VEPANSHSMIVQHSLVNLT